MKKEKLKPGQIRITPSDNRLMTMPPYVNTVSKMPNWFNRIGKHQGSLRRCAGTIDMLSAGVTIPSWSIFEFRFNSAGGGWESRGAGFSVNNYADTSKVGIVDSFSYEGTGECPVTSVRKVENSYYPKLINPWKFETAPGWSSLILPTYWEPSEHYQVLPAIVHTDFYHTANIVLNLISDKSFTIKYGTPLAQVIPFKRGQDFEEIIFQDESQYKYLESTGFGFGHIFPPNGTAGPYRRERARIDEALENSKKSIIDKILRRG